MSERLPLMKGFLGALGSEASSIPARPEKSKGASAEIWHKSGTSWTSKVLKIVAHIPPKGILAIISSTLEVQVVISRPYWELYHMES